MLEIYSAKTLRVPSIDKKEGETIEIEALLSGAGEDLKIGGANIKAKVFGHGRGEKIIVFKKKRRKQYKRTKGHRQDLRRKDLRF